MGGPLMRQDAYGFDSASDRRAGLFGLRDRWEAEAASLPGESQRQRELRTEADALHLAAQMSWLQPSSPVPTEALATCTRCRRRGPLKLAVAFTSWAVFADKDGRDSVVCPGCLTGEEKRRIDEEEL